MFKVVHQTIWQPFTLMKGKYVVLFSLFLTKMLHQSISLFVKFSWRGRQISEIDSEYTLLIEVAAPSHILISLIRNVKNLNQWNLLPWEVAEKSFFSDFYGRNKKRSNLIMFFSFPAYHLHIHSSLPIGLIRVTWRTCGETTTLWINAAITEPVIWKVTTRGRRRSCTQKQA